MPHRTMGFQPIEVCEPNTQLSSNMHLLTSSGIPILSENLSNFKFSNSETNPNLAEGVLVGFENNGIENYAYHGNELVTLSKGYYNDIAGLFSEDLQSNALVGSDIQIGKTSACCPGMQCTFESTDYTINQSLVGYIYDGGFNLEISPCIEEHWLTVYFEKPIARREAKQTIYDLICSIKNQDSSFEYDQKLNGRVIFARDIYIGKYYYPYVGLTFPNQGNSFDLVVNPELDNSGSDKFFEEAYKISNNAEVRLNFFKTDYRTLRPCADKLYASYGKTYWNTVGYITKQCCVLQSDNKNGFRDYINPNIVSNLLIFSNGYRPKLNPFAGGGKWWNLGWEHPTKTAEESINTCNDFYEGGNYWNKVGNQFIEAINNENIVYVDGHHGIHSANHLDMAAFGASLTSCSNLAKCATCVLNKTPNPSGFEERYKLGKAAAIKLWDNIVANKVRVARNPNDGKISGKIDIVAHSMGYAFAKGMADELSKPDPNNSTKKHYLTDGNKLGYFYVIAPENAIGHATSTQPLYRLNVNNFDGVWQYGSNFLPTDQGGEKACHQDGVAPQIGINGLETAFNVFIPQTKQNKSIRKFNEAHYVINYGWIFVDPRSKPTIKKRN